MKMGRYWKERGGGVVLFGACAMVYFVTFNLYHLPLQAVFYPTLLCGLLLFAYLFRRVSQSLRKREKLRRLQGLPDNLLEALKEYDGWEDEAYQEILRLLLERDRQEALEYRSRLSDTMDYFTIWVHQIKTPIAAMRLRLQREDTPQARAHYEDLFRIEQYVDMVLTYLRLQSESTDYVFREGELDDIVKGVLRKLAGQFIGRGLKLQYEELHKTVVTDEKWLSFVLEQILSNALKYTHQGSISIFLQGTGILCVQDTGIGIAPEDVPRIFEKGYTGYNGREDKRASGLGLFLCKKICDNLGIRIWAQSEVGVGTTFFLDLEQEQDRPE